MGRGRAGVGAGVGERIATRGGGQEAAGEILLDVHAMDIEPSAIAIFREGLAGLAMDGSVRGSVRILSDTVLIGGALRIVVRARVHLPARRL